MSQWEYKVIPAPVQGTKARGVKTAEDRFALTITDALNEMAIEGWEYLRAETLPCETKKGLTGRETTFQNLLVFRRATGPSPLQAIMERAEPLPVLTLDDPDDEDEAAPRLGPAVRD